MMKYVVCCEQGFHLLLFQPDELSMSFTGSLVGTGVAGVTKSTPFSVRLAFSTKALVGDFNFPCSNNITATLGSTRSSRHLAVSCHDGFPLPKLMLPSLSEGRQHVGTNVQFRRTRIHDVCFGSENAGMSMMHARVTRRSEEGVRQRIEVSTLQSLD